MREGPATPAPSTPAATAATVIGRSGGRLSCFVSAGAVVSSKAPAPEVFTTAVTTHEHCSMRGLGT